MNEYGLLQPWLDESQSEEKNILSHYCNNKAVDNTKHQNFCNRNTQYRNNRKLNKTANTSLMLSTGFHQIQLQFHQDRFRMISRRSRSYLVKKWENHKKWATCIFFKIKISKLKRPTAMSSDKKNLKILKGKKKPY
jgi:hypothetical protein